VGLLAVLGGGGSGDGPAGAARSASPLERRVAGYVRGVRVKEVPGEDVRAFRQPQVQSVRCRERSCAVGYVIGLPGAGRIREDQNRILRPLFAETDVQRIRLRVWRNVVVGPRRRLKDQEESGAGTALLDTTCDRGRAGDIDWAGDATAAIVALKELCRTLRFSPNNPAPARLEPPGPQPGTPG
jgi:hypothetical protein